MSVIRCPRNELTAGGFARAQILFHSYFGGAAKPAMRALARLEHTAGDRPAGEGALSGGKSSGETDGGFGGRPSVAVKALGAWDGMLRAIGAEVATDAVVMIEVRDSRAGPSPLLSAGSLTRLPPQLPSPNPTRCSPDSIRRNCTLPR